MSTLGLNIDSFIYEKIWLKINQQLLLADGNCYVIKMNLIKKAKKVKINMEFYDAAALNDWRAR